MVTKNRAQLARRAIQCLANQSWENKELIIVDDGDEDYTKILEPYIDHFPIRYHRINRQPGMNLGALRNLSLELADGDFCAQWDDDDWYHPSRLETCIETLERENLDAVVQRWTLMHINTANMRSHPFRAELRYGTPGTIVHRNGIFRYPNVVRREDTIFLWRIARTARVGMIPLPHSHLFVRCYHGSNTWGENHFSKRLYRSPKYFGHYVLARFIRKDLFSHPFFHLSALERESIEKFNRDSGQFIASSN